MKLTAYAVEDIPANRLVCLVRPTDAEEDKIYIRLAKSDERPDFYSKRDITAGEEVAVELEDSPVWMVEMADDIPAGTSISTGPEGRAVHMSNSEVMAKSTIGYTLNAAKAGEVVKFRHIYKVKPWVLAGGDNQ